MHYDCDVMFFTFHQTNYVSLTYRQVAVWCACVYVRACVRVGLYALKVSDMKCCVNKRCLCYAFSICTFADYLLLVLPQLVRDTNNWPVVNRHRKQ